MLDSSPPQKEALPELVLLMAEPLDVDAVFLRSAYEEVLGLSLSSNTEFVKGEWPFFMFQSAGILVSIVLGDRRYGDPYFYCALPS
jgi:hypothetical protein